MLRHPKAPAAVQLGAEGMSLQRAPLLRPCWDSCKALSAKTHPQSNHQRSPQVRSSTSPTKISTKPWKGWTNPPSLKTLRTVCITTMSTASTTWNLTSTETTGCSKLWWTFWGRKVKVCAGLKLEIVAPLPSPLDFACVSEVGVLSLILLLLISFAVLFLFLPKLDIWKLGAQAVNPTSWIDYTKHVFPACTSQMFCSFWGHSSHLALVPHENACSGLPFHVSKWKVHRAIDYFEKATCKRMKERKTGSNSLSLVFAILFFKFWCQRRAWKVSHEGAFN